MYVDLLTSRLEKLKKSSKEIAALDAIRLLRLFVIEELDYRELVKEDVLAEGLEIFGKGHRPFQDWSFLGKFNWRRCTEVVKELVKALKEAGMENGSLSALLDDLNRDKMLAHHLCRASLDNVREHLEMLASKYRVEPDLLRVISTTPLVPVFARFRGMLSPQENPVPARSCTLCGSAFSLAVYEGGFRFLLCPTCGHRVRVDFFFCPRCGNTEPQSLGFIKIEEEPALQVDYCTKCGNYYKAVNEDLTPVSDPLLVDLSTMDLDPLGREKAKGTSS